MKKQIQAFKIILISVSFSFVASCFATDQKNPAKTEAKAEAKPKSIYQRLGGQPAIDARIWRIRYLGAKPASPAGYPSNFAVPSDYLHFSRHQLVLIVYDQDHAAVAQGRGRNKEYRDLRTK